MITRAKIKKIIFFTSFVLIALIVILFLASSSQARYMSNKEDTMGVVAKECYFTSHLLQETAQGGEIKQVELYGSNKDFVINIYNTFEGKVSDIDIEFTVTLAIVGENLQTDTHPNGTYCTLDGQNMESDEVYTNMHSTVSGTLKAGESLATITVYPQNMEQVITVTAQATAPYSKTLVATFSYATPQAVQQDVDALTVLHRNYTELLVVAGTGFSKDVKIIIGTLQDMQTNYAVRDIDVAKRIRYGDNSYETFEKYAEQYTEDSSQVDQSTVFYFYLSEFFAEDYVAGQAYNFVEGSIIANRTYVVDFLGELKVESINYDANGTAVLTLTTDTWMAP